MLIIIDNYDSFTYNLVHYFEMLNIPLQVIRNDAIDISGLVALNPSGIVISPGPCTPREAGISLEVIGAFKGVIPLLGICLGHQAIGMYFGATIEKGAQPVHGKVFLIDHCGQGIFSGLPSPYNVTRYHSLQVRSKDLPDCLEVTATTQDGVIMGIRHKTYDIEGVQFHPEAILTQFGHELLNNFLNKVIKR